MFTLDGSTIRKSAVWVIAFLVAPLGLRAQQPADTVLYNAKVLTVDKNFAIVQAIAITGNKIAATGTNEDILKLAGNNTKKFDLKGRTAIPGLIHTHIHLNDE